MSRAEYKKQKKFILSPGLRRSACNPEFRRYHKKKRQISPVFASPFREPGGEEGKDPADEKDDFTGCAVASVPRGGRMCLHSGTAGPLRAAHPRHCDCRHGWRRWSSRTGTGFSPPTRRRCGSPSNWPVKMFCTAPAAPFGAAIFEVKTGRLCRGRRQPGRPRRSVLGARRDDRPSPALSTSGTVSISTAACSPPAANPAPVLRRHAVERSGGDALRRDPGGRRSHRIR